MNSRKRCFLQLIMLLFTVSIAFTALPGSFISSYNFLVQMTVVSSCEENTQALIQSHPNLEKTAADILRILSALNPWVWIRITILLLIYLRYPLRLPRYPTIITRKVRLDE